MKPLENFNSQENIKPADTPEEMGKYDALAKHNGMYPDEIAYKEAETAYKLPNQNDLAGAYNNIGLNNYDVVTTEPSSPAEVGKGELVESVSSGYDVSTEFAEAPTNDEDVIDVEAKVISIDPESPDDTEDIEGLIENNDEVAIGKEKLSLTPKLKNIAKGAFSSLNHLLDSSDQMSDNGTGNIDLRTFIMAEPDYDESYDYTLLTRLLDAQYRRKRALMLSQGLMNKVRYSSAETLAGNPPPPEGPETPTPRSLEGPEGTPSGDEALKIENTPKTTETPQIEYQGNPPALTYDAAPDNTGGQKQITQS